MVLSDSSDEMPPSDNDPYSSGDVANVRAIYIENMPKPMPILGSLLGFGSQYTLKIAGEMTRQAEQRVGRPLNNDEANAIAFWQAKNIQIRSYAPIIGISGGLWRAYNTRETFRFPFFQPDKVFQTFSKEFFPHASFPMVRGATAVIVWHGMRGFWYSAAGVALAKMFLSSYAMSVSTIGIMNDSRMVEFGKEIREKINERRKTSGTNPGRSIPQVSRNTPKEDDASPSAGIYGEEDFNSGGPEMVKDTPTRWKAPPLKPVPVETRAPENESKAFDYFDDAASPTSGREQGMARDTKSQPQGSAWERIRRGGVAPTQTSGQSAWSKRQSQAQGGESADDNFTSTQTNEEKRYSREDAQQDFDARIERERQGGDFTSNKKW